MKNKSPNISTYFYSEKDYQDDYCIFNFSYVPLSKRNMGSL